MARNILVVEDNRDLAELVALHLRDLAQHILAERLLLEDGNIDHAGLEHIFHMLMVINPRVELYLLDPEGRILAYSAPPGKVRRERIDLAPLQRFLADPGGGPILGDDPPSVTSARCSRPHPWSTTAGCRVICT
ncbi:MAG: PDC sensor domain-containing protein [Gammaproteobacteria bacterium]|jgi:hypothetical protein